DREPARGRRRSTRHRAARSTPSGWSRAAPSWRKNEQRCCNKQVLLAHGCGHPDFKRHRGSRHVEGSCNCSCPLGFKTFMPRTLPHLPGWPPMTETAWAAQICDGSLVVVERAAERMGSELDQRNDALVVEAGGPDDADGAEHRIAAAVGAGDDADLALGGE